MLYLNVKIFWALWFLVYGCSQKPLCIQIKFQPKQRIKISKSSPREPVFRLSFKLTFIEFFFYQFNDLFHLQSSNQIIGAWINGGIHCLKHFDSRVWLFWGKKDFTYVNGINIVLKTINFSVIFAISNCPEGYRYHLNGLVLSFWLLLSKYIFTWYVYWKNTFLTFLSNLSLFF